MEHETIEYYIADIGGHWGIFREGVQIAVRRDAVDAIAFANFFADRETLTSRHDVRVIADSSLRRTMSALRHAA